MPENDSSQTQSEQQTSAAQSGETLSTSTVGATPALTAADYRFTAEDGVEPWLIGKTGKETAQITKDLYTQALTQVTAQPQPQMGQQTIQQGSQIIQQGEPNPQNLQPTGGASLPTSDAFIENPAAATQQYGDYLYQQKIAPELQAVKQATAQQARQMAQMQYADEFKRWGPQIVGELNKLPLESQTPEMIQAVIKYIRGDHVDELVDERLASRAQELQDTNTLRADGTLGGVATSLSPTDAVNLESDKITYAFSTKEGDVPFAEWCKRNRITPDDVDDMLRKAYPHKSLQEARKEYVALLEGKQVFTGQEAANG